MTQIGTSDHGPVRIITISNPPRGYMNAETAAQMLAAIDTAITDKVRILVFTGGLPGVFIRHYDVGEIVTVAHAVRGGAVSAGGDRSVSPVYALVDRMMQLPIPTIAAINGMCMGGGFEFALTCDIRLAVKGDYTLGLPETRLGIVPGIGGLQLLARLIGLSRATEMVMRGTVIGPDKAAELGIVTHLVEADVLGAALALATDIAERPPHAVRLVKQMAQKMAAGESLADGMIGVSHAFFETLTISDDAMEKMQMFLDNGEDITSV
jgi:enoyl-CoA hydratase